MNVQQMIELMGTLGVGEGSNVVPENIYLQYLNVANLDLYTSTANFNDDILIFEDHQNVLGINSIDLEFMPYIINQVLVNGQKDPLFHTSLVRYNTIVFQNPNPQTIPNIYTKQNYSLYFYPFNQGTVYSLNTTYSKQPEPLTLETQESEIPYPIAYHNVLVDKALCYLFDGEGGFRSTKNQDRAARNYEIGYKKLIAYLQGSNAHRMATFRNA
jgi:hypothetical protein